MWKRLPVDDYLRDLDREINSFVMKSYIFSKKKMEKERKSYEERVEVITRKFYSARGMDYSKYGKINKDGAI
jgi:hypothetical protein